MERSLDSRVLDLNLPTEPPATAEETAVERTFTFWHQISGEMELAGSLDAVATYLDAHQGWFRRCAKPMRAEPLGERGYVLTIGQYGAFGYEVEPKLAVELLPGQDGCYRMLSVPLPDDEVTGYCVDYRAALQLVAAAANVTRVVWELDLSVGIEFPGFIRRLPHRVIQNTGDRLLAQIVRQVSRRLTHKVRADFHASQAESQG